MIDSVYRGSNVLVWGALGFLGQHVVEALLARGANVSVLCRPRHLYQQPWWAERVKWHELSGPADSKTLTSAISSAELIYNFAGASGAVRSNLDPAYSLNANCSAQLEFLAACAEAGHCPHVVFASSWLVYDIRDNAPVKEDHPVAPRSMYGAHKLCIENYLRIFQLRNKITYTICRISNPYGRDPSRPTNAYKILNSFVQSVIAGTPIHLFGDGSQLRDFLYISDLTEALLLCGQPQARNEVFNISLGVSYSLRQAVETLAELAGRTQVIHMPWPEEYEAAEPGSYLADVGKAREHLHFSPSTSLRQGLAKTMLHFRSHHVGGLVSAAGASA